MGYGVALVPSSHPHVEMLAVLRQPVIWSGNQRSWALRFETRSGQKGMGSGRVHRNWVPLQSKVSTLSSMVVHFERGRRYVTLIHRKAKNNQVIYERTKRRKIALAEAIQELVRI